MGWTVPPEVKAPLAAKVKLRQSWMLQYSDSCLPASTSIILMYMLRTLCSLGNERVSLVPSAFFTVN
ncbi:hypothetical protein D3C87_2090190 [compost metagenome]